MGRGAQLTGDINALIAAAKNAAGHAYAPYSRYHVGAAVLLENGEIISAANFENASSGLSLCAETVAIAKTASEGKMAAITALAIAGGEKGEVGMKTCMPCGRCRQIIKEIADVAGRDIAVHCVHGSGYDTHLISELLPHAFGPENLK